LSRGGCWCVGVGRWTSLLLLHIYIDRHRYGELVTTSGDGHALKHSNRLRTAAPPKLRKSTKKNATLSAHPAAEWGRGGSSPFQRPARTLARPGIPPHPQHPPAPPRIPPHPPASPRIPGLLPPHSGNRQRVNPKIFACGAHYTQHCPTPCAGGNQI